MWCGIITYIPDIYKISYRFGCISKSLASKGIELSIWDIKNYASYLHSNCFMKNHNTNELTLQLNTVRKIILLMKCIYKIKLQKIIYLSNQGILINQVKLKNLILKKKSILFISDYFEGLCQSSINLYADEQWAFGDYVISSGDYPILGLLDALSRLIPNTLSIDSSINDSFDHGLLKTYYNIGDIFTNKNIINETKRDKCNLLILYVLQQEVFITWLHRNFMFKNIQITKEIRFLLQSVINMNFNKYE